MDLIANLNTAETIIRVENEEALNRLENIFQQIGYNNDITFQQFEKIVQSKNPFFVERMFKIFDKDGSNTVSKEEFMSSVRSIVGKPPEEKLRLLFDIYDIDGDGTITFDEMKHVMRSCMFENGLTFSDHQIDELTKILLTDADTDKSGVITFDKLKSMLSRHIGLIENLSLSVERWLLPQRVLEANARKSTICQKLKWTYIRNNSSSAAFLASFIIINAALFVTRAIAYRSHGVFMMLARANGQCLNFCCSFILALMLRRSITFLRSHGFAMYIPLDHHVYFHKLTGWFICAFSLFHTLSHVINNAKNYTLSEKSLLVANFTETALLTGWILLTILAIMMIPAQTFMRSAGKFEIFYYTHLFYIGFFVVLIFHAPNFWKWFIVPGFIFILETVQRFRMSYGVNRGKTYIEKGIILPSQVIHLVIKRPASFDYSPGDYVFVRIPAIAKYEWHPFTISSAPELEGEIWLHIRAVGEWTNRLLNYFINEERLSSQSSQGYINPTFSLSETLSKCDINQPSYVKLNSSPTESSTSRKLSATTSPADAQQDEKPGQQSGKRLSVSDRKLVAFRKFSVPVFGNKSIKDSIEPTRRLSDTFQPQNVTQFRRPSIMILPIPEDCKYLSDDGFDCESELPNTSSSRAHSINSLHLFKSFETGNAIQLVRPLCVHVDGPYGSPTSHIFRTQHAVMIATGIGVTPFASILQSIMQKHVKSRQHCPKCKHCWSNPMPQSVMKLRKVDFVWINRDQKSFEWFVNLLSELEIQQAEFEHNGDDSYHFLDIHMYITSALDKSDIKAIGLQLALDLMHEKSRRDLITRLKTRTHCGRPKWHVLFKEIAEQRRGKVTVFFCGPSQMGRILRQNCTEFGFKFCKEIF